MSQGLKLSILCPERRLVENITVQEITLPTCEGEVQILAGHAPMVGVLETGGFAYHSAGADVVKGVISTGFFEVADNSVNVLAETLELSGEIDVHRAKKAQKLAEETLKAANLDEGAFKKHQLKLQRSLIRQQIAGRSSGIDH